MILASCLWFYGKLTGLSMNYADCGYTTVFTFLLYPPLQELSLMEQIIINLMILCQAES